MSLLQKAIGGIPNGKSYGAPSPRSLRHEEVVTSVRQELASTRARRTGFVVVPLPNGFVERVRNLFTPLLKRYLPERQTAKWGYISILTQDPAVRGYLFPRNRSLLSSRCVYLILAPQPGAGA